MKLSVSLPGEDVDFLDAYASEHELPSRSAALQAAVRAFRLSQLSAPYADAWDEWEREGEAAAWESTIGDGT